MANAAEQAAGAVVERFVPGGRILGYLAAVVGLVLAAGAVRAGLGQNAALAGFGLVTACLAWVVLIRPMVSAHEHGVLLRNMVRDAFVPWSSIQQARVLQTLQVVTAETTYHGLGVSRSARSLAKDSRLEAGPTPVYGVGGALFSRGYTPRRADLRAAQTPKASYSTYVESRLQDLAKGGRPSGEPGHARVSWAPLPLLALAVAAGCVALIFLA